MELNQVKIIIHAGMPKTASTTLQENLSCLAHQQFIYPRAGRYKEDVTHHEFFYALCGQGAIRTPLPQPRSDFHSLVESLKSEIQRSKKKTIILSSEMLWNPVAFDDNTLRRLKCALEPMQVIVLTYLRDPATHVASAYAQRIKGPQHYCGKFYEHLQELRTEGWYDYKKRINTFSQVFGANQLVIEFYERPDFDPARPFREVIGVPVARFKKDSANVRPPWLFIAFLRYRNCLERRGHYKLALAVGKVARLGIQVPFVRNVMKRFDKFLHPMDPASKEVIEYLSSCYSDFRQQRNLRTTCESQEALASNQI